MRVLWIVVYPLVAFAAISVITQNAVFFMLPLFTLQFPAGILVGMGVSVKTLNSHVPWAVGFTALFFLFYVWFVFRVERLGSRTLRMFSIMLVVALLLGIKGCGIDIRQFHSGF